MYYPTLKLPAEMVFLYACFALLTYVFVRVILYRKELHEKRRTTKAFKEKQMLSDPPWK